MVGAELYAKRMRCQHLGLERGAVQGGQPSVSNMDVWEFCLCFGGALGYVRQCS